MCIFVYILCIKPILLDITVQKTRFAGGKCKIDQELCSGFSLSSAHVAATFSYDIFKIEETSAQCNVM